MNKEVQEFRSSVGKKEEVFLNHSATPELLYSELLL
jgi:hypothetical protein